MSRCAETSNLPNAMLVDAVQLWAGGYLHTSDIAVVDANGYVHITDRIKEVIKTGGEWVSSLQIEDLISQCAGVAEAAVIGVKDEKWGERPLALVVKRASDAPTYVRATVGDYPLVLQTGSREKTFALSRAGMDEESVAPSGRLGTSRNGGAVGRARRGLDQGRDGWRLGLVSAQGEGDR
jgi:acyl-CoA synthetase (AMP-forming)/AMP-acid ligase II